jgi:low temperature requirement protein LtrA
MIASNLLRISIVIAVIGMAAGLGMGMAQNFELAPAHAHLNLVGYVSLFLAGLYYKLFPAAGRSGLATVHAWVAVFGGVAFPLALVLVLHFGEQFAPLAAITGTIVFVGMVLFAIVVFRTSEMVGA